MMNLLSLATILSMSQLVIAKVYYSYDNQAAFTERANQLQSCSSKLNVTSQLLATTNGVWEVRIDYGDNENDALVDSFQQCLDPDVQYPLSYLTSLVDEKADYEYLFQGPDLLPAVASPMLLGSLEDLHNGALPAKLVKRIVSQTFWVNSNLDLAGSLRWSGKFTLKTCRTITGKPAAEAINMHNMGDYQSATKVWSHINCQKGGARTIYVGAGDWLLQNVNVFSLLQTT